MRQHLAILAELEASAMERMLPVYVKAITASLRGENPAPHWEKFQELFTRAYIMADLIGRLSIANQSCTLGPRLPYAEPLIVGPWSKAIAMFLGKVPLARRIVDKLMPEARRKAFWVTSIESTEALTKIQERIADRLRGEIPTGNLVQDMKSDIAAHLSHARLETVVRTNTMAALTDGQRDEAAMLGSSVALMRRDEIHDRRTRGAPGTDNPGKHWQMDGFVESPTHPIWNKIGGVCGYNCFIPETEVQGTFVAASKAWYSGPVIELQTSRGNRLTCTPNHPILTRRGWIAADQITKLDYLFSYIENGGVVNRPADRLAPLVKSFRGAVPDQNVPSAIKHVFDNFLTHRGFSTLTQSSPLDFHGDAVGLDSDISIVTADGWLPNNPRDHWGENLYEFMLINNPRTAKASGHRLSAQALLLERNFSTPTGAPSRCALPLDRLPVHSTPLEMLRCGSAAELNTLVQKDSSDGGSTNPEFLRELFEASAGSIAFDNVCGIERRYFCGHVYGLQSVSGWMIAQNIVTSNCRGSVSVIGWASAQRLGFAKDGVLLHDAINRHNASRWQLINEGKFPDPGFG